MPQIFGTPSKAQGLDSLGIQTRGNQFWNLGIGALIELAIKNGEGLLSANGALCSMTGKRTGRSPKDKFVVRESTTEKELWWGNVNVPIEPEKFDALFAKAKAYLADKDLYIQDLYVGADPTFRMPIRIVTEQAWHSVFARQLFVRPDSSALAGHVPEFTVVNVGKLLADPAVDGTKSEAFVLVNFAKRMILIGGTQYAGEIKKSIFTIMNYFLPKKGVLSMHCSANIGPSGDCALFFGLSGTGKTTLSADPERQLIGDDEHGWSDSGIFNFEGGCYAKCIKLSLEREPQIWNAIKFGAIVENVVMDPDTRIIDFDSDAITENTRVAYPVDFIEGAVIPGIGNHPKNVIFLTCDAFGVLPPVSKLTPEAAMYHFLSGYTAKVAGTEAGITEPQTTFSACFGSPFLPLHPNEYAKLLGEKISKYKSDCWLVNTGWTGGKYGVGERMSLSLTRAIIHAVLNGSLARVEYVKDPIFRVMVPTSCPGVPTEVLSPKNTWKNPDEYDCAARELAHRFQANAEKMGNLPKEILEAGPHAD